MSVPRLPALSAVLLATCTATAHAALDLASPMQAIDGASVATVVLVPPMAIFQQPLDRAGLQSAGCHYTTDDPAAIRKLAGIVRSADVTVNAVYQRTDLREGVYFALDDGSRFSVLFADNSGGRLPVLGIAETTAGGQIRSASVSASRTLSTAVREWARERGGVASGAACDLQAPVAADPQSPPAVPR